MNIKVVRGNPTPEELAAVVSVLTVAGAPASLPAPARSTSAWGSRRLQLRTARSYGPTGWLAPALPR